jgi:hypothetical protein
MYRFLRILVYAIDKLHEKLRTNTHQVSEYRRKSQQKILHGNLYSGSKYGEQKRSQVQDTCMHNHRKLSKLSSAAKMVDGVTCVTSSIDGYLEVLD